jgi:hypothetical protein
MKYELNWGYDSSGALGKGDYEIQTTRQKPMSSSRTFKARDTPSRPLTDHFAGALART